MDAESQIKEAYQKLFHERRSMSDAELDVLESFLKMAQIGYRKLLRKDSEGFSADTDW